MDLVEAEIKEAKIKFEEDILRIGEKADNPNLVKKSILLQYCKINNDITSSLVYMFNIINLEGFEYF